MEDIRDILLGWLRLILAIGLCIIIFGAIYYYILLFIGLSIGIVAESYLWFRKF